MKIEATLSEVSYDFVLQISVGADVSKETVLERVNRILDLGEAAELKEWRKKKAKKGSK